MREAERETQLIKSQGMLYSEELGIKLDIKGKSKKGNRKKRTANYSSGSLRHTFSASA